MEKNKNLEIEIATQVFSVCPWVFGGFLLRLPSITLRQNWLEYISFLCYGFAEIKPIPFNVSEINLRGGIDFFEAFKTGNLIYEKGILKNKKNNQILVLNMVGKLQPNISHILCNEIDNSLKDPFSLTNQFNAVVLIDESFETSEENVFSTLTPPNLFERTGLILNSDFSHDKLEEKKLIKIKKIIQKARKNFTKVKLSEEQIKVLVNLAAGFSIEGFRQINYAIHACKVLASLDSRMEVIEEDIGTAVRLIYLPKAKSLPDFSEDTENKNDLKEDSNNEQMTQERKDTTEDSSTNNENQNKNHNYNFVDEDENEIDSEKVLLPKGLLENLLSKEVIKLKRSSESSSRGKAYKMLNSKFGYNYGSKAGLPGGAEKLKILETIQAALPFQNERKQKNDPDGILIKIFPQDLRIYRKKNKPKNTTIFLVDASGSSASQRLGEAKGAVELLLSDCYVRRDEVAVVVFRGKKSELILSPTRSLVRAKKSLGGIPGGGGTPLSMGLDNVLQLSITIMSDGKIPTVVILSDGGANVSRDGKGGREKAFEESIQVAKQIANKGIKSIYIDTGVNANEKCKSIANAMNANYFPLPRANSKKIMEVISSS